jgi:hypothetical protein
MRGFMSLAIASAAGVSSGRAAVWPGFKTLIRRVVTDVVGLDCYIAVFEG